MLPNAVTVLRKETASVGASVRLPIGVSASDETPASAAKPAPAGGGAQQARGIESNDEYAILEVTCACGQTMHIQCRYGG